VKKVLPALVCVIAAWGSARPALAQAGAAITRSQSNATVAAIERQVREATQAEREKHAASSDVSAAVPSRKQ